MILPLARGLSPPQHKSMVQPWKMLGLGESLRPLWGPDCPQLWEVHAGRKNSACGISLISLPAPGWAMSQQVKDCHRNPDFFPEGDYRRRA